MRKRWDYKVVDVYQTEPERRAALEELTSLRRELKTETAKGAKAAKSDPRFIAAQARLDAAKSAAGMRTSAEDLAALNKIATRDVATANMTPSQKRAERQALNQPSRQYFKQVRETVNDTTRVPTFKPRNKITPEMIAQANQYGYDYSKARMDWVLVEPEPGKKQWAVGVVGALKKKPTGPIIDANTAQDYWMSDAVSLGEASKAIGDSPTKNAWSRTFNNINLSELSQAIPEIRFSEFQEIIYQLTLERDEDITIEDILDKYDDMYGKG